MKYIIGIDVGGTGIQAGIIKNDEIIHSLNVKTPKEGLSSLIIEMVTELCIKANISTKELLGVGLIVPGVIDKENGIIISCSNLPYKNLHIIKEIKSKLDIDIFFANDGDAAALGEYIYGKGKHYNKQLMLMIGTGLGGAYIDNGNLIESELGHFILSFGGERCGCGLLGCAEIYCSASALVRMAENRGYKGKDAKEFFRLVSEGNKPLNEAFSEYIGYLAAAIISLSNLYHPEIIVLGGGITAAGDMLLAPLKNEIQKQAENFCYKSSIPDVAISSLGKDIGIFGAASIVNNPI